MSRRAPGHIRDAIARFLEGKEGDFGVAEIRAGVEDLLGAPVAPSSIRSSLRLKEGSLFERTGRGRYRLRRR